MAETNSLSTPAAANPASLSAQETRIEKSSGNIASAPKGGVEIDFKKLAYQTKPVVYRIIGRPIAAISSLDQHGYAWGTVGYLRGRVDQIDYTYKTKPSSVREALEKVGLEQTSKPFDGPLTFYWNADTTGLYVCCGLEMDNVVISKRFTDLEVGFKRR